MEYNEMSVEQLKNALKSINEEMDTLGSPKPQFLCSDDDDGDDYQENLELGWHLDELRGQKEAIGQAIASKLGVTEMYNTLRDDCYFNPNNEDSGDDDEHDEEMEFTSQEYEMSKEHFETEKHIKEITPEPVIDPVYVYMLFEADEDIKILGIYSSIGACVRGAGYGDDFNGEMLTKIWDNDPEQWILMDHHGIANMRRFELR